MQLKHSSTVLEKLKTDSLKPVLPFFALASIFGSPTSLGSFWITIKQKTDMTTQVMPERDRVDLQL